MLYSIPMFSFDDFRQLCIQRRSVRYFDPRPIDAKALAQLIDVACMAPSVENTQPWHFHVVTNADLKVKLMATACYGNFVAGAPAIVVMACNKAARPKTQEILWNPKEMEFSCAIALDHLMLAATAMSIGSCWVSLHHGPAHDVLKLPDHHAVIGAVMLGYTKPGQEKADGPHERQPMKESCTFYE